MEEIGLCPQNKFASSLFRSIGCTTIIVGESQLIQDVPEIVSCFYKERVHMTPQLRLDAHFSF